MKKKKITKETIQKIIHSLPAEAKQKMINAHKSGKKITLKIKKKQKDNTPSPYQNK